MAVLVGCAASAPDRKGADDSAEPSPTTVPDLGCPTAARPVPLDPLPPALTEVSGLAPSHRAPGHWWVHQDSGSAAELYVLDATGGLVATWTVDVPALDWEDLALVVDPATGAPTLYVGDIGDNLLARAEVTVLRIAEPEDPLAGGALSADVLTLTYDGGAEDAESLLVDPRDGTIHVVAKTEHGRSAVYAAAGEVLTRVAELDFATPPLAGLRTTGADWLADGRAVVIRTYLPEAYVWPVPSGATLAEALAGDPCPVPIAIEPQGEAIAFTLDGAALVQVSEGEEEPLTRVDLSW